MSQIRKMLADELACSKVVHVNSSQLQITASVTDGNNGQIFAELVRQLRLLGNHGKDDTGNVKFAGLLHDKFFCIRIPIGGADGGDKALLTGSDFNTLDNSSIERIE